MPATLAIVGGVLGVVAYFGSSDRRWLLGAAILVSNWPYTMFAIMPTNNKLMAMAPESAGPEARRMIERRGRLHAMRTALGALATVVFLWAGP